MDTTDSSSPAVASELVALRAQLAAQQDQLTALRAVQDRAARRAHLAYALAAVAVGLTLLLNVRPAALARTPAVSLAPLVASINGLTARVAALEYKTAPFTRADPAPDADEPQGGIEITLTGANLHIVNGMGQTNGLPSDPHDEVSNAFAANGLGNLIIGYNEPRAGNAADDNHGKSREFRVPVTDARTGSHNLIVGVANNYTGIGGIAAGEYNAASSDFGAVTGGAGNIASGPYSAAIGGGFNNAVGNYACITCGANNLALSDFGSISGGQAVKVIGKWGWATGGIYDPNFTLALFGPGKYSSDRTPRIFWP